MHTYYISRGFRKKYITIRYNRRHLELDTFIFGSIRVDAYIKTFDGKELGFGTLFQEIILTWKLFRYDYFCNEKQYNTWNIFMNSHISLFKSLKVIIIFA